MDTFRWVEGKFLRRGFTTGTCAAAAAKAAVWMLLHQENISSITVTTPHKDELTLAIDEASYERDMAICAVKKDAGDDPDVTHGLLIFCEAKKIEEGITLTGGPGVGRVTKPGLDQPPGEAAINSVPRNMIMSEVREVCQEAGYEGGIHLEIRVPGGEEVAKKTFNPRLGIEGGISIIGTSGIVEPMSHQAIVETVKLELSQLARSGSTRVLLTPGNYGETFSKETLALSMNEHVSCSNYVGDAMDMAVEKGFSKILLVGHIGKLIKLALGLRNTHSSMGDGRMEALVACALEAGADAHLLRQVLSSVTTDAALKWIEDVGLLEETMRQVKRRVEETLQRWVDEEIRLGCICFTKDPARILFMTEKTEELITEWRMP